MGFTKRELIEFLDGLVELASEENKPLSDCCLKALNL